MTALILCKGTGYSLQLIALTELLVLGINSRNVIPFFSSEHNTIFLPKFKLLFNINSTYLVLGPQRVLTSHTSEAKTVNF